jgi:hypothetical protein
MTESNAWVEGIYPGYRTKTIKYGNCTIEINRPILTDEERLKREEEVKQAMRSFWKGN